MNVDLELENWKSLWQTDVQVPADLREKANRQLRRMRTMLVADIGVTVVMGGAAIAWAMTPKQPPVRLLASWVWMTLIAAWLFRWFNDRGNWTGAAPNTEVFLELLQRRYRASLRSLKFGYALGVVQLLFSSAWVYFELNRNAPITILQFLTLKANLAAWSCALLLFVGAVRFSRKLERELAYVRQLRSDWAGSERHPQDSGRPRNVLNGSFVSGLIQALMAFQSRFEELDWRRRRKKKSWKT